MKNHLINKGNLIEEYKPSKAMWIGYVFFIVMMLALGIIGYLLPAIFPGDKGIVFVGKFALVLFSSLAIMIYLIARKRMDIPKYLLYENGVEKLYGSELVFMPIEKLTDFYFFTTGKNVVENNLAFKCEGIGNWEMISNLHSGNLGKLIAANTSKRVEYLMNQLNAGKTITFYYTNTASELLKSFTAFNHKSFLKVKTKNIDLSKTTLTIEGVVYPITSLEPLHKNLIGIYTIKDKTTANRILSFKETSMWSFNVFEELWNKMFLIQ